MKNFRKATFFPVLSSLFLMALAAHTTAAAQGTTGQAPAAPQAEAMFDTDRNLILKDSDGDGVPDLTEAREGTDPNNAASFVGAGAQQGAQGAQGAEAAAGVTAQGATAGFPANNCRPGYRQAGPRLCISINVQNATGYLAAQRRCRVQRGSVASQDDLYYLYVHSNLDASYNPNGRWIGNFVADDRALCGNRSITFNNDPDRTNFEGTCHKNNSRGYWCAHDRF